MTNNTPGPLVPATLNDIETPRLLLDHDVLSRNIAAMASRFRKLNVPLRPHLKTAKSIDVAKMCAAEGADRWTVSTLREAEYFAAHGFSDMLYAVSIIPAKIDRVMRLNRAGANVAVCLDTPETAKALAAMALDGPKLRIFLEIDVDQHRTGFTPGETRLIETGRVVSDSAHLELAGVMAHGGESYSSRSVEAIVAMAEQERSIAVAAAQALRGAGVECPVVSIGSSPTARHGQNFEGVSEVRAGVYMFQDVFQANLGVCALDDVAARVLASVVSHSPHLNRLILDAGGLALSKDRSCAIQTNDCGFGLIANLNGAVEQNLFVSGVSQEHGYVTTRDGSPLDFGRHPIGAQLMVLPNHACMTAAAYDEYILLKGNRPAARWPRVNGWDRFIAS